MKATFQWLLATNKKLPAKITGAIDYKKRGRKEKQKKKKKQIVCKNRNNLFFYSCSCNRFHAFPLSPPFSQSFHELVDSITVLVCLFCFFCCCCCSPVSHSVSFIKFPFR